MRSGLYLVGEEIVFVHDGKVVKFMDEHIYTVDDFNGEWEYISVDEATERWKKCETMAKEAKAAAVMLTGSDELIKAIERGLVPHVKADWIEGEL